MVLMSKAADACCVDEEVELEAGKYSIIYITKKEGKNHHFFFPYILTVQKIK